MELWYYGFVGVVVVGMVVVVAWTALRLPRSPAAVSIK
jgi:hypothetical protein